MIFYNQYGEPVFYTEDDEHLYDFYGRPVGYFFSQSVYSFSGRHLGWFEKGWISDSQGHYVFYNEYATGGPIKPLMKTRFSKEWKDIRPSKGLKRMRPMKPARLPIWSNLNLRGFFRY